MKQLYFIPLILLSLGACKPSTDGDKKDVNTHLSSAIAANNKVIARLSVMRDGGKGHADNVEHELNRHMMIDGYLRLVMEGLNEAPKDIWAKEEKNKAEPQKSTLTRAGESFVKESQKRSEEAGHRMPSFMQ